MKVPERLALIASNELVGILARTLAPLLVPLVIRKANGLLVKVNDKFANTIGGRISITQ